MNHVVNLSGTIKYCKQYPSRFNKDEVDWTLLVELNGDKIHDIDSGVVPLKITGTPKSLRSTGFTNGMPIAAYNVKFSSYQDKTNLWRYELKTTGKNVFKVPNDTDWNYTRTAVLHGWVDTVETNNGEHFIRAKIYTRGTKNKTTTIIVPVLYSGVYVPLQNTEVLIQGKLMGFTRNKIRNAMVLAECFAPVVYT